MTAVSALDVLDRDVRAALPAAEHPRWLDPMKAVLADDRPTGHAWVHEPKLDGIRLLLCRDGDEVRLLTRNRKRRNETFIEVADALRDQRGTTDAVFDAEVVALDDRGVSSFSRLQGRSQLQDARRARATGIEVVCLLFDVLHLDGHDLRGLPLHDRRRVLEAAVTWRDPLRLIEQHDGDGDDYWRRACANGWEGVIAKRADAPYRGSRSRDWRKLKCVAQQEFVVGGFTDPKGGRSGFGSLLVGFFDGSVLRFAGRVGTGFDEATLRDLRARLDRLELPDSPFEPAADLAGDDVHWVQPRLVAQVGFGEWTHLGRLRHPRFLGLRDDKDPEEVVREDVGEAVGRPA